MSALTRWMSALAAASCLATWAPASENYWYDAEAGVMLEYGNEWKPLPVQPPYLFALEAKGTHYDGGPYHQQLFLQPLVETSGNSIPEGKDLAEAEIKAFQKLWKNAGGETREEELVRIGYTPGYYIDGYLKAMNPPVDVIQYFFKHDGKILMVMARSLTDETFEKHHGYEGLNALIRSLRFRGHYPSEPEGMTNWNFESIFELERTDGWHFLAQSEEIIGFISDDWQTRVIFFHQDWDPKWDEPAEPDERFNPHTVTNALVPYTYDPYYFWTDDKRTERDPITIGGIRFDMEERVQREGNLPKRRLILHAKVGDQLVIIRVEDRNPAGSATGADSLFKNVKWVNFLASALGAEDPVYLDYGHFVSAHPTENKIVRLKHYSVYVEDLDSGEVTEVIQAQNRRIQVAGWTKDGSQMLVVLSDPIMPRDKWVADVALIKSSDIIDGHHEKGHAYLVDVSEFPIVTKYGDWSWGKLIASYEHGTDGFSIGPKGEYFLWDLTGPPYAPPYDDYYLENFLPVMTLVDPTGERVRTSSDPKLAFHSGGMHFSGNGEVLLNATKGGVTIANLKLKKQNKIVPEGSGVEWAALSHDGQRIAYVTVEGRKWGFNPDYDFVKGNERVLQIAGTTTIYLLDAAKPGKRELYSSERVFVSKPAFSADGSTLYFVQEVVDDTRGYISGKDKKEGRKIYSIALD